jgi:hypothetical protein
VRGNVSKVSSQRSVSLSDPWKMGVLEVGGNLVVKAEEGSFQIPIRLLAPNTKVVQLLCNSNSD